MKRKWLIAIASLAMAITFVLGISACKPKEAVKSDEEVAQTVINTLNSLYLKDGEVKNYETPDNYKVLGQVNVDGTLYAVTWTPTAKTQNVTVGDYVTVSAMDDKGQVTVEIKRATVDIEYTLTASVTAGSVAKTASYDHKIPKKSSEEAITATIDLSSATNRVSLDTDNNEQTWKQNGVTLFNHGNVADYTPIRLYKNTTIEISMENAKIIHIDFHSAQGYSDSPYPEWLKTSLESSDLPIKGEIAVSEDGLTISVDFESPQEVVIFKATAGQLRLTSMDVEAIERDPNEHVHNWTYEHIANTWTHKATCTAEGCDVNTKTESCTPKRNVCACGYTYTAKEIVDALFALEKDQSLPGTYSLTGLVTKITDPYSTQYNNVTFEMTVEGKTITAFRVKGSHATEVKVGGYATVNGELLDYNGTKEFTQGGSVVAFSDDRTAQQKVDAALQAVAATVTVTKAGETALPASTEPDVTFAWDLKPGENLPKGTTFANGKLTVNTLPAEDATVTFVVTATCGTETVTGNTKEVTVTIKAQSTEPQPSDGDGSKDSPFTVSQALDIIKGLEAYSYYTAGGADPVSVYVRGIVTVVGTSDNYGIKNFYIADAAGDTDNDVLIYNLNWSDTVKQGVTFNAGDTILIQAYLQNYNGEYEITYWREGTSGSYTYHNGYIVEHTPAGGQQPEPGPGGDDEEKDVIYTLTSTTKGTNSNANDINSYTVSSPCTVDGITWDVLGNTQIGTGQYDVPNWRFGGKNSTCVDADRTITGRGAIIGTVKSVKITFGATSGSITVNSVKLKVYSTDPGAGSPNLVAEKTVEWAANSTYTVAADDAGWKDCYYQLVMNLTSTATSNKWIVVDNIQFCSSAAGGTTTPKTEAEKVADVKAALKLSKTELLTVGEEVELPATQGEAEITWAISGTSDLVKIEGGKLIVQKLPEQDTEVTLIATITVGAASDTTDVKITVKAEGTKSFVPMAKPKAGSNYYMGMKTQDGQYHYLTGAMASGSASHYMATVTDIESAKKVTLAGSDTAGWTMQCEGKYIEITVSGTYYNAVYNTTKSGTWKWDATHSFFTWTVNGSVYALGTYGTYTTVGTVAQSRFDDSGEWFAVLGTWGAPEVTDQDKVDEALAAVETAYDVAVTGDYALPTPTVEGVTFAWQVTEGSYSLTNGNSLNIQSLPAEDTKVKLTLTATCGTEGTGTKEITVTVHPAGWTKHVHNYQYVYTSGLKHNRTCTAPGCDEEGPVEEACTPELNVCPFCGHTATAEEACNAVWSFPTGTAKYLPGTYTFSGIVNQKDGTKSGNTWEFEYKVFLSDGTVDANQTTRYELFVLKATVADGLNITELLEGDKVTVTGSIGFDKRNSSQWWRGFMTTDAKITAYTKKTDEEKATEIMKKLGDSFDEIPAEQKTFKKIQSQVLSLPVIKSTFGYYSKAGSSVWTIADEGMKQYCSISVGTDAAYLNIKAVPDVETKIKLKLTVTFGTVVKEKECEVTLAVMTDQEMADEAATITKAPKERFFTVGETLELPAKSDKYPKASLSWAVKETSEYAKIENNVLTISKLPEDADTKVTLVVTATVNGTAGSPHELEITLMLRDKFTPITTPAYGYYHLSVEYYYNGSENFLSSFALKNSGKNTQYLETNKDVEKAVVVALVPIPGETNKFFIKATGGSNDNLNYLYINTISGTKVIAVTTSLTSANTPLATWEWDAENHIFFVTIGEEKYIMGGTNSSQLQVNTLTYAKEHSSFNYARLGTYEGHEEKLTAPAQATSIKLFDATGVEINSGDTVKVKAEENWGIVLHYTVAPEAPLSARLTLTSEDTTKVLASFGSSAMGFTVYARSAAQAGDKVKLTITVLDTNVTAELTVEVVAAGEIQDVHGEKVTDPMTIEELRTYVTKLDSSVKGAYAKAGHNRNFYVKGKLIVEEGSGSYRNCYLGNNKEISLGSLSASSLKDTAKEMGLQLADFNGIEVIVSGDFGFRTLTDGNTQLAARTANIHQANFTADDKIAFAQAALTVDFAAFKAVDAEIDLAAAAVNKFDVTVAWALTAPVDASTYVTLADNKLKIVKLPGEVTEFTLKATLTLEGGTEATKEFTFSLIPAADVLFDMSKNTSSSSTALTTSTAKTFLDTACGSNEAFTDVTTATQAFKGNSSGGPFQGAGCLKLGASKKDAELVLTFSKKVAKVIIVWASWSASEGKLTVNEVGSDTFYSTFTTETFTLTTASETLTLKSVGRVVITSISVYFETAPAEITIPEEMRGTFKCTGGMDIEEGGLDPDFDGSNVPDLVVSEHSITWGEKVITNLKAGEDGDPNSFTFQIGDDSYGLNFTGNGWMLVKFGPEGEEPVEGYMFGDMGGGPELGL